MKTLILTAVAVAGTVSLLISPSFADTKADNEKVFRHQTVNIAAKTNLPKAAFKTYQSKTSIAAFDARYKVRGEGAADKR